MQKRNSWEIQRAVIKALLLREMKTRFGNYKLGYVWAVLEPLSHVLVLAIILGYAVGRSMPGINYPLFLVSGIMPWLLFSNTITRGMVAVSSNTALFNYRQLKPFDTLIARIILETTIHFSAYTVLLVIAWLAGIEFTITQPLEMLTALFLLVMIAFGISMPLCFINKQYPELAKFVPMVLKPMYFISGIFFSVSLVPDVYHPYLLWNPVIHAVEISRHSIFYSQTESYGSLVYLATLAIIILAIGMSTFRLKARALVTS